MQRKVFSAAFKAKVAMEALTGRKTINEVPLIHQESDHRLDQVSLDFS